ncbi:MAG: putative methionine-R-sulfoxide reductase with GAF domain [Candidatus Latescibacterota bacterium]|jgi:putative methionine-R-sulfoxide reductase with GAF domain
MAEQVSNTELEHRNHRLEILLKISRMMNATTNQETLITNIAAEVAEYIQADRCSIFFYDRLTDELYTHLATGLDAGQVIRIPCNVGIAGYVFNSGEVKNVRDVSQEPLFTGEADKKTGYVTKTLLTYPLKNRGKKTIGVLQLLNKMSDPNYFTEEDEIFLQDLVDQISDLLDLILRKDELAARNAVLEAQMQQLSSVEYLIGDRTAINTVFKYNRKLHYWGGVAAMVLLTLMAVTSLVMVRADGLRSIMLGLHTGTGFGLGFRYYIFTDTVSVITLAICVTGLLMYVYPPLNRWLKGKKDRIIKEKFQAGIEQVSKSKST